MLITSLGRLIIIDLETTPVLATTFFSFVAHVSFVLLTEEQHQMTPVDQKRPLWVTKWVDYTNKYGFGFQLSDRSVGILFNDTTRLLLTSDGRFVDPCLN